MPLSFEAKLRKAGFTPTQTNRLTGDERFVKDHQGKTFKQVRARVESLGQFYGIPDSDVRQAVYEHARFFSHKPKQVVSRAARVYGGREGVMDAIRKSPAFVARDHARVVREAVEVYGKPNRAKVKRALLAFPELAGLDHARVVRQRARLGRLVGLNRAQVKALILEKPALASYSPRRYLAALDVGRQLAKAKVPNDARMLDQWLRNWLSYSPYVPGTKRLRVTRARREGRFVPLDSIPLTVPLRRSLTRSVPGGKRGPRGRFKSRK